MKLSVLQRACLSFLLISFAVCIPRIYHYVIWSGISEWFTLKHLFKFLLLNGLVAAILSFPYLFLERFHKFYTFLLLLSAPLLFLDVAHLLMYDGYPNSSTYFTIFSSNSIETTEFLNDYLTLSLITWLLFYSAGIYLTFYVLKKSLPVTKDILLKCFYFGSIFSIGILYFYFLNSNRMEPVEWKDAPAISSFFNYLEYKEEKKYLEEITHHKVEFDFITKPENGIQGTHFVVIGESTSSHHMSLYGYGRNTNPLISKIDNLQVLMPGISPHAHTIPSLEKVLTFKSNHHPEIDLREGSIIDLANQSGFETYWISNQAFSGANETKVSAIASKCKHKKYLNSSGTKHLFDEELIPLASSVTKRDTPKIVFIHLMGTHLSYSERYPNQFDQFNDNFNQSNFSWDADQQNFINEYDNAILYNDYVLSQLIAIMEKLKTPATLTYFSDHGDEVYDFRNFHGHSDLLKSEYMTEVPFIFWSNFDVSEEILSFKNKNYPLDHFSDFWSEITGVYCEHSENELPKIQAPLDVEPISIPTQNNLSFEHQIWCHRVNGIERFKECKQYFNGFEVDLVFEGSHFDVNHPPQESINLTLSELIGNASDTHQFWFDLKNLTVENASFAALQLNELIGNKSNIIIESACHECLIPFDDLGFKTVYYLPFLHKMNQHELSESLAEIQTKLNQFVPSAISQEYDGLALLSKYFPNCQKVTWDIKTEFNEKDKLNDRVTLFDTNKLLKVILIRFDSSSYR